MLKTLYRITIKGGPIEGATFLGSIKQGDQYVNVLQATITDTGGNILPSADYAIFLHGKRCDGKTSYIAMRPTEDSQRWYCLIPAWFTDKPGKLECNIEIRSLSSEETASEEESITVYDSATGQENVVEDALYRSFSDMFSFNVERTSKADTVAVDDPDEFAEFETTVYQELNASHEEIEVLAGKVNNLVGDDGLIKSNRLPHGIIVTLGEEGINPSFSVISKYDSIIVDNIIYQKSLSAGDSNEGALRFINIDGTTHTIREMIINHEGIYLRRNTTYPTNQEMQSALSGKLDKLSNVTSFRQAYVKAPDGSQIMVGINDNSYPNRIVAYDDNGQINVLLTPTQNSNAVSKKYLDDSMATKLNSSDYVIDNSFSNESTHPLQNKVITEKIEEVEDIAKGAQQAVSFANYSAMIAYLKSLDDYYYRKGQSIYIATLNVPDLWIYDNEATYNDYTYVDDDTFVNTLKNNGSIIIGSYTLCALENQKVDLTDYYTKAQVEARDNAKLDKVTNATTYAQSYVKEADGSQGVRNISNEAVANTLTLRDSHGNLIANNTNTIQIVSNTADLNDITKLGIYQIYYSSTSVTIRYTLNDDTELQGVDVDEGDYVFVGQDSDYGPNSYYYYDGTQFVFVGNTAPIQYPTNMPNNQNRNAILFVDRAPVSSGDRHLLQTFTDNNGNQFTRYSTNNGSTWTVWKQMATTDYVDNAIAAAITTAINDNY